MLDVLCIDCVQLFSPVPQLLIPLQLERWLAGLYRHITGRCTRRNLMLCCSIICVAFVFRKGLWPWKGVSGGRKQKKSPSTTRRWPNGIPNIGNTCFMNALIQVLCVTPNFRKQLKRATEQTTGYSLRSRLSNAIQSPALPVLVNWPLHLLLILFNVPSRRLDHILLALVDAVQRESDVPSTLPQALIDCLCQIDKRFEGKKQQDSYEFYNKVIGKLEDLSEGTSQISATGTDTEKLMKKSPISLLFGGQFCTIYRYSTCEHVDLVFQRFTSIPVQNLPKPQDHTHQPPVRYENDGDKYHLHTQQANQTKMISEGEKTDNQTEMISEGEKTDNQTGISSEGEKTDIQPHKSQEEQKTPNKTIMSPGQQKTHDQSSIPPQTEEKDTVQGSSAQKFDDMANRPHRSLKHTPQGTTDLERGLTLWTDVNRLDDLSCKTCGSKDPDTYSRCRILCLALPPVLVLQFNRFQMNFEGSLTKLNRRLSFPEYLDAAPFCSSAMTFLNNHSGAATEPDTLYRLYGVVCHVGSIQRGHYTAHVRTTGHREEEMEKRFLSNEWRDPERYVDGILKYWKEMEPDNEFDKQPLPDQESTSETKDKWYTFDDTRVVECTLENVLSEGNACILLYERVCK